MIDPIEAVFFDKAYTPAITGLRIWNLLKLRECLLFKNTGL
jgi:hypothetical protein